MGIEDFQENEEKLKFDLIPEKEREVKEVVGESRMGRNWNVTEAMEIETDPNLFYRVVGDRDGYDLIKDIEVNGKMTTKLEQGDIFFNRGYAENYFRRNKSGYIIETTPDAPLEPAKNVKPEYHKLNNDLEIEFISRIWKVNSVKETGKFSKPIDNPFGIKSKGWPLKEYNYELVYVKPSNKEDNN